MKRFVVGGSMLVMLAAGCNADRAVPAADGAVGGDGALGADLGDVVGCGAAPQVVASVSEEAAVSSLLVDGEFVYFTTSKKPGVYRARREGGAAELLVMRTFDGPSSLRIHRSAAGEPGSLLWADTEGVMRAPLDGPFPATPVVLAPGRATAVELLLVGDAVVWLNGSQLDEHAVFRTPIGGGATEKLVPLPDFPTHVATAGGRLYVTFQNRPALGVAPLGGGMPQQPYALTSPGRGLASDGSAVWVASGRQIDRTFVDDAGTWHTSQVGGTIDASILVVRDGFVWVMQVLGHGSHWLLRLPAGGGEETVLTKDVFLPTTLAVDERCVYWGDRQGRIQRMAR